MSALFGTKPAVDAATRGFLATFERVELSTDIADRAVSLRRKTRLRIPDAIILATARVGGLLLVTRNTKDFPADEPGIRMPYRI